MKTNVRNIAALVAVFAMLAMSFAAFVPTAHADTGGNQVRVVDVSFSGSTVTATATANICICNPSVQNVLFVATISFSGTSQLNINKQGVLIYSGSIIAPAWGGTATASFSTTGQGQGYYLVTVTGYDAATGLYLGSDWVDPQGTAG